MKKFIFVISDSSSKQETEEYDEYDFLSIIDEIVDAEEYSTEEEALKAAITHINNIYGKKFRDYKEAIDYLENDHKLECRIEAIHRFEPRHSIQLDKLDEVERSKLLKNLFDSASEVASMEMQLQYSDILDEPESVDDL